MSKLTSQIQVMVSLRTLSSEESSSDELVKEGRIRSNEPDLSATRILFLESDVASAVTWSMLKFTRFF